MPKKAARKKIERLLKQYPHGCKGTIWDPDLRIAEKDQPEMVAEVIPCSDVADSSLDRIEAPNLTIAAKRIEACGPW